MDTETLKTLLVSVVQETMQFAKIVLWVKEENS